MALDHHHSLADSSWWEEGGGDLVPASLFWRVGKEGLHYAKSPVLRRRISVRLRPPEPLYGLPHALQCA
jgi:hypothetical protein